MANIYKYQAVSPELISGDTLIKKKENDSYDIKNKAFNT